MIYLVLLIGMQKENWNFKQYKQLEILPKRILLGFSMFLFFLTKSQQYNNREVVILVQDICGDSPNEITLKGPCKPIAADSSNID